MVNASLRYGELRDIALGMIGDTEENRYALDNLRKGQFPMWRSFIAHLMHKEGYTQTDIGDCLKRDHSTVSYLIGNIDSITRSRLSCNREVIEAYDEFRERAESAARSVENSKVDSLVGEITEILCRYGVEAEKIKGVIKNTKQIMYESEN